MKNLILTFFLFLFVSTLAFSSSERDSSYFALKAGVGCETGGIGLGTDLRLNSFGISFGIGNLAVQRFTFAGTGKYHFDLGESKRHSLWLGLGGGSTGFVRYEDSDGNELYSEEESMYGIWGLFGYSGILNNGLFFNFSSGVGRHLFNISDAVIEANDFYRFKLSLSVGYGFS